MVKKQNGRIVVYNRYVIRNGITEYTVAKLMDHSWWYNDFVNAVCLELYVGKEKRRIAWIGNYADTFIDCFGMTSFKGLNKQQINRIYKRCWNCDGIPVPTTDFTLDGKYLVNHTKRQYVDCTEYYKRSVMTEKWCLHPLPILTCIGNGLCNEDYSSPTDDSTEHYIGAWAWDEISITDKPVTDYTEIALVFKDKGWDQV